MMLSIVLPIYNEEGVVDVLYESLTKALAPLGVDWEVLFVDDGSADGTLARLQALRNKDPRVAVVELARNFGHQPALAKGLEFAKGEWVVTMHSDLEDLPEHIPLLYAKAQEGYDVVYTVRDSRQKTLLKDLGSKLFYFLLRLVSEFPMPLHTGDFCIMARPVVDALKLLPERHRYLAGLRAWVGFKQTGLLLPRAARLGQPKQSYSRLMLHAADALFSFSTLPLKLLGITGLLAFFVSMAGAAVVLFIRLTQNDAVPIGWASTILSVIFLGGIQLMGMGILGEYLARIYDETRGRPSTIVRRVSQGS